LACVGISAVGHLCCTDRGWHIANICWQVLALAWLNICVILMWLVLAWLNLCVLLNGGKWGLAYCSCLLAGVGISTADPLSSAEGYCCCMSEACGFRDRSVHIIKYLGRLNNRNQVLYALAWVCCE